MMIRAASLGRQYRRDVDIRDRLRNIAELAGPFNANPLQTHRDCDIGMAVIKQMPLLRRADQMTSQCPSTKTAFSIKLTELRDGALNDASSHAYVLDQSPVAMRLAVFLACARS
jgi:hypothetical protein